MRFPRSTSGFEQVLNDRYSCRAYRPELVDDETLDRLFTMAQRTPSWCNTQPWQVHLVSGAAVERFGLSLTEHVLESEQTSDFEMPSDYLGVYGERRRSSGFGLYETLGIERSDKLARGAQALLNYTFFGAPHVAVITTDRAQGVYGAVDCGGYVSTFTLAAQALGLGSVPQAAIAMYSDHVREFLELPADRLIVCAISFGHPDQEHRVNTFRTERASRDEVVVHARD